MGRKPKPAQVRAKFFWAGYGGTTGWRRSAGTSAQGQPGPALRLSLEEREEVISRGLAQRRST